MLQQNVLLLLCHKMKAEFSSYWYFQLLLVLTDLSSLSHSVLGLAPYQYYVIRKTQPASRYGSQGFLSSAGGSWLIIARELLIES